MQNPQKRKFQMSGIEPTDDQPTSRLLTEGPDVSPVSTHHLHWNLMSEGAQVKESLRLRTEDKVLVNNCFSNTIEDAVSMMVFKTPLQAQEVTILMEGMEITGALIESEGEVSNEGFLSHGKVTFATWEKVSHATGRVVRLNLLSLPGPGQHVDIYGNGIILGENPTWNLWSFRTKPRRLWMISRRERIPWPRKR